MQNDLTFNCRRGGLNWAGTAYMIIFHAIAALALFNFSWSALGVAVLLWWVSGSLGIGIGYHRLLTHRGFKTPKWVEYFLTLCGALSLQGGPIPWVAIHRVHHMHTEGDGDPHTPRHGLWWSHMGWMLNGQTMHCEIETTSRYAADLAKDRFHLWLSRWHYIPQIGLGVILLLLGGWQFVLWGIFARVIVLYHVTWLVNSAAHVWGGQRFKTQDDSRNNWWVALMSFGEGWHNNHHAHPASARHGLIWYEIDVNWYGIWVLKKLGLVKNIRLTTLPKKSPDRDQTVRIKKAA